MGTSIKWDVAGFAMSEQVDVPLARPVAETLTMLAGLLVLFSNVVFNSWALAGIGFVMELVGAALRLARIGADPESERSNVRTGILTLLLIGLGIALASVVGPAGFVAAAPGYVLLFRNNAKKARSSESLPS